MPGWAGSDRGARLPQNWHAIRGHVLKRDGYRCTWIDPDKRRRCEERATEVDHIRPGDDHSYGNLRSLCEWHHAKKSGAEGARARAIQRAKVKKKFRRTETHPGLL